MLDIPRSHSPTTGSINESSALPTRDAATESASTPITFRNEVITAFPDPKTAVVPAGLLGLSDRWGLQAEPELRSVLSGDDTARLNASRMALAGTAAVVQFQLPSKIEGARANLREVTLGKLACALMDQEVGALAIAVDGKGGAHLPAEVRQLGAHHQLVLRDGAKGPIGLLINDGASPQGASAPTEFRLRATILGARQTPHVLRMPMAVVNVDAPPQQLKQDIEALHQMWGGRTVAVGCRSGLSKSGIVSALLQQRALAAQKWAEGGVLRAGDLKQAMTAFHAQGVATRGPRFADGGAAILEQQAELLLKDERNVSMPRKMPAPCKVPVQHEVNEPNYVTVEFNGTPSTPQAQRSKTPEPEESTLYATVVPKDLGMRIVAEQEGGVKWRLAAAGLRGLKDVDPREVLSSDFGTRYLRGDSQSSARLDALCDRVAVAFATSHGRTVRSFLQRKKPFGAGEAMAQVLEALQTAEAKQVTREMAASLKASTLAASPREASVLIGLALHESLERAVRGLSEDQIKALSRHVGSDRAGLQQAVAVRTQRLQAIDDETNHLAPDDDARLERLSAEHDQASLERWALLKLQDIGFQAGKWVLASSR